jgi:flagellin-specific chaperone FliS
VSISLDAMTYEEAKEIYKPFERLYGIYFREFVELLMQQAKNNVSEVI